MNLELLFLLLESRNACSAGLLKQRDALIDEIQNVKQEEKKERERMQALHQSELSSLSDRLAASHDREMRKGQCSRSCCFQRISGIIEILIIIIPRQLGIIIGINLLYLFATDFPIDIPWKLYL